MFINNFLDILINVPLNIQLSVVIVLGLLFIVSIKLTKESSFRQNLLKSKHRKGDILKKVLKQVDALHYLTVKLQNDAI